MWLAVSGSCSWDFLTMMYYIIWNWGLKQALLSLSCLSLGHLITATEMELWRLTRMLCVIVLERGEGRGWRVRCVCVGGVKDGVDDWHLTRVLSEDTQKATQTWREKHHKSNHHCPHGPRNLTVTVTRQCNKTGKIGPSLCGPQSLTVRFIPNPAGKANLDVSRSQRATGASSRGGRHRLQPLASSSRELRTRWHLAVPWVWD